MYVTEEVVLKIPAGVDSGDRMRVAGKGEGGLRGGPPGDLFVVMELEEHPFFERRDRDLWGRLSLSLSEAALGTETEVELLDGREKVKLSPGSQPGQVIMMRKRGMPVLNSHRRGDLYLELEVEIPAKLTAEEKKLFKELARLEERKGKGRARLAQRRSTAV
jgi:molecular chaperone DnaJ